MEDFEVLCGFHWTPKCANEACNYDVAIDCRVVFNHLIPRYGDNVDQ